MACSSAEQDGGCEVGGVHNVGLPEGTAGLQAGFPASPAGPGLARGAEGWGHRPGGEA